MIKLCDYQKYLAALILPLFLWSNVIQADDNIFVLTSEQWNVPRNESAILQMPALQQLMQAYKAKQQAQILVKYPGGDEGTLWASELRAWLISLGIASKNIELIPGARDVNTLELHLLENKQKS